MVSPRMCMSNMYIGLLKYEGFTRDCSICYLICVDHFNK